MGMVSIMKDMNIPIYLGKTQSMADFGAVILIMMKIS